MSKTLLVVHHTPSPATRELLEAVLAGAKDPDIAGVDIEVRRVDVAAYRKTLPGWSVQQSRRRASMATSAAAAT